MDNNNFYNNQQPDNNGYNNSMNDNYNNGYNNMNNGYNNMNNGYNNGYNNVYNNGYNNKTTDNGKTSMICGIASIVVCFIGWFCCIGYAGVPLAIIAIVFANKSKNENGGIMPKEAKIGMITGIVGLGVLVLGFGVGFVLGIIMAASGM